MHKCAAVIVMALGAAILGQIVHHLHRQLQVAQVILEAQVTLVTLEAQVILEAHRQLVDNCKHKKRTCSNIKRVRIMMKCFENEVKVAFFWLKYSF